MLIEINESSFSLNDLNVFVHQDIYLVEMQISMGENVIISTKDITLTPPTDEAQGESETGGQTWFSLINSTVN